VNDGVVQIRNLARGIFPVQMDEAGLSAALEDLVATMNHLMPVTVSLQTSGDICIADAEVSMHLYRIAQEALNNAVKHGNAQHIEISLLCDDEKIVLAVSDDGQGFQKTPPTSGGMGLKTMQYRARSIGAELTFGSSYGRGATLICTLPLPDKASERNEYVRNN
jgi:signal transduction histidine kinase